MKAEQLFEVADSQEIFQYEVDHSTKEGYFTFDYGGKEFTTIVEGKERDLSMYTEEILGFYKQNSNTSIDPREIEEQVYDVLEEFDIVDSISFTTMNEDTGQMIGVNDTYNFPIKTLTTTVNTVAKIIEKMIEVGNEEAVTYEATSNARDKIYQRVFKKFQRNTSETYEVIDNGDEKIIIEESVLQYIMNKISLIEEEFLDSREEEF